MKKIQCPYCNYDGSMEKGCQIYPISFPMFCGKCRMKFYPEVDTELVEQIKRSLEDLRAGRIKKI